MLIHETIFNHKTGEVVQISYESDEVIPEDPTPFFPDLASYQFHAMLDIANLSDSVAQAIANIPNPYTRAVVTAKLNKATTFVRTDESVIALSTALNIQSEYLDQLWLEASML